MREFMLPAEREKCRHIAAIFNPYFESYEEHYIVEAGKYGFVFLNWYSERDSDYGSFDHCNTFTESKDLFEGVWDEYLSHEIFIFAQKMDLLELEDEEILERMSSNEREALLSKKEEFTALAGL